MGTNEKGLTLVEVILSVLIFTLTTVVVMSLFSTSFVVKKKAQVVTNREHKIMNQVEGNQKAFFVDAFEIVFDIPGGAVTISSGEGGGSYEE